MSSESAFRRTLQRLDADAFDDLAGAWAQQAAMPGPEARRVMAGGGKTRRGSASGAGPGQHLLAALGHAYGAVLGQVEVGAKTNEIPMFPMLLDRVDITGAVITADAMHAQRSHATYPAGRGAHYALTVKRNQPGLFTQLAARPGVRSPSPARPASAGTGGLSGAPSKSQRWPPGWPSPMPPRPSRSCAAASCPKKKKWSSETVYAITSLTATQPSPAGLAAIRGHCLIEDRPHWVRDLDYDEDRSQIRTASGPRVMATLRNIAITVLRLAGHASIAAALRYHARRRTGHYGRS